MFDIRPAVAQDAAEILALQRLAYRSEALRYDDWRIPPLTQTLESLLAEFATSTVLKAVAGARIIGSVRARTGDGVCAIGRLIVSPEVQGQGVGTRLMEAIEAQHGDVARYELFTGSKSEANLRLYQRLGYEIVRTQAASPAVSLVFLEKRAPGSHGSLGPNPFRGTA